MHVGASRHPIAHHTPQHAASLQQPCGTSLHGHSQLLDPSAVCVVPLSAMLLHPLGQKQAAKDRIRKGSSKTPVAAAIGAAGAWGPLRTPHRPHTACWPPVRQPCLICSPHSSGNLMLSFQTILLILPFSLLFLN